MSVTPDLINVLHVDDEPDVARVTAKFLERRHDRIEVEVVSSVASALTGLDERAFDCVVSDYDMPERTGIEFLETVRERSPDLPFILFTGKGSEEVASDAISAGATDYLQKNTSTDQYDILANRIENAVSRAQSQRAARHLRELAESTNRILYIIDPEWAEVHFINSAYEELMGRSVEALRANPTDFLEAVHPEHVDRVRQAMTRLAAGEPVDFEVRVNAAEAYGRWVAVRGEPIRDDDGAVVRLAGFGTDITEQKQVEATLTERTERLQEAQRVAGVGSWEWNAATDTVAWSDETYRIFGWDPDEKTDPTFDDWLEGVHPADRDHAGAMVQEAMETGSFPTFEHRIQRPDGEVIRVTCRGEVHEPDEGPTRITGTILDITDREETDG